MKNINQEISFLTNKYQNQFQKFVSENYVAKKSLREQFPYNNPDLIRILEQMLSFNPYFRPTAK